MLRYTKVRNLFRSSYDQLFQEMFSDKKDGRVEKEFAVLLFDESVTFILRH